MTFPSWEHVPDGTGTWPTNRPNKLVSMDADSSPPAATSPQTRRFAGQPASTVRITGLVLFLAALIWRWGTHGIPNERTPLFAWILAGVALVSIGRSDSRAFRFFWDWAPMMAMLALMT
ncbi:MAG: hypothetical protein R2706_07805 [Acidimicrobiales bacterium]